MTETIKKYYNTKLCFTLINNKNIYDMNKSVLSYRKLNTYTLKNLISDILSPFFSLSKQ